MALVYKYVAVLLLIFCNSDGSFVVTRTDFKEKKEKEYEIGTNWALLLSGSSTWGNYRHQADICHAYQILHQNGIPDSNIVVMMYDDIAYNSENPDPGIIINHLNGPNVYEGVPKDYTGESVTPENFINILQGNEDAMRGIGSGKVIKSGPNDRIFLNMVDHGDENIFCFPNDYITADELIGAITNMYRNQKFKEMLIYVESCHSGSLFLDFLPSDISVLAVTASQPDQDSYACYFDDSLSAYLGDLFSVSWMEDSDSEDLKTESIEHQYEVVDKEISTVENPGEYGDANIRQEDLSNYLGDDPLTDKMIANQTKFKLNRELRKRDAVKSSNVPFYILEKKLEAANSENEQMALFKEMVQLHKNRMFLSNKVEEIVLRITKKIDLVKEFMKDEPTRVYNYSCYKSSLRHFHDKCFNLGKNSYALQLIKVFAKLCNHGYSEGEIEKAMVQVCDHPPVHHII